MMTRSLFGAAGVVAAGMAAALALTASGPAVAAHEPDPAGVRAAEAGVEAAGERLGARIQAALREGGPFFTAGERAVIERACGYSPGSWDGFEANMSDRSFVCRDGRRVDSPELRQVMETAGPRIERRVSDVMARADIEGEIERITQRATEVAMRSVDHAEITRRAVREAERAMRDAEPRIREAQQAAARALTDPEFRRAIRDAEAAAERAVREAERAVEESERARRR